MAEITATVAPVQPETGSEMIAVSREREHRIGEIHQPLFRELVSLPSGVDASLDGKNHLLIVHESKGRERVASLQYNERIVRADSTTIFVHRALSLVCGPDGILRGESHYYKAVTRPNLPLQRKELPDTIAPLTVDDIHLFRRFAAVVKRPN